MQELTLSPKLILQEEYVETAIAVLKELISIPSFSKEESKTADVIEQFLKSNGVKTQRSNNNVWVYNRNFNCSLPTILLNSHHDTVKPNAGYTLNPFETITKDGKLFGLGSNDAGGALVSLAMTFLYFNSLENLKYNLIFAATAEEEISGKNGVASILEELGEIDFAIVGEPTEMNLAIAEKGLLVLDCVAHGTSAHAAHHNPNNAIVNALKDVQWFTNYHFPKVSELLGEVKMNVTMIKAGVQHNVIPDKCEFSVDIRTTDLYNNIEILNIIEQNISAEIYPRSLRLNSSGINSDHPIVLAAVSSGLKTFGSPTLSDQALMNFPSVKIGPGNSLRSHSSDEFIYEDEIHSGIKGYIKLLSKLLLA